MGATHITVKSSRIGYGGRSWSGHECRNSSCLSAAWTARRHYLRHLFRAPWTDRALHRRHSSPRWRSRFGLAGSLERDVRNQPAFALPGHPGGSTEFLRNCQTLVECLHYLLNHRRGGARVPGVNARDFAAFPSAASHRGCGGCSGCDWMVSHHRLAECLPHLSAVPCRFNTRGAGCHLVRAEVVATLSRLFPPPRVDYRCVDFLRGSSLGKHCAPLTCAGPSHLQLSGVRGPAAFLWLCRNGYDRRQRAPPAVD